MKERVIAAAKKMKREQWIVCGLVGLLLLVIAMPVKEEEQQAAGEETQETVKTVKAQTEEETDIRREYENQLAGALEQVEGVGKVSVAVTMETTGTKLVEKDRPEDSQSSSQTDPEGGESRSESLQNQETTVYEQREDGSQIPYISSETYPEIRGVLVVAEGGADPVVVQQIQEAAMALFHVEAHKIKVMKMK
ncbi:MAG TPA: stage III sporulation protein AG [Candidatus Pullilachnospira intestinigallinarum]|nr:stage III sporulation protein AG [Candidatus Pullilachnospira intestinigallinarum]